MKNKQTTTRRYFLKLNGDNKEKKKDNRKKLVGLV